MTSSDAPFGPWGKVSGLTARLKELHAAPQMFSNTTIAYMLSREFHVTVSRNSVIGKIARLGLAHRYGASKGGGSKPGRVAPRPRPKPVKSLPALPTLPARTPVERPGTLTLLELRDGDCHWPSGDGPSFTFCGRACIPERSYCDEHFRMAHSEPREKAA